MAQEVWEKEKDDTTPLLEYVVGLKTCLSQLREIATVNVKETQEKQKTLYDKGTKFREFAKQEEKTGKTEEDEGRTEGGREADERRATPGQEADVQSKEDEEDEKREEWFQAEFGTLPEKPRRPSRFWRTMALVVAFACPIEEPATVAANNASSKLVADK
ncbi:hypothetical protein NDU88_004973 [Pleurodeles waltl]|uniref:Uncharacterized protein n=1 Tax=Pleurodeles waltl TaxID=8319 RepID=A0AAV7UGR9_PLEWA|nr:hypothetical protein NDU88_004973 [Pleurodeles waltl]